MTTDTRESDKTLIERMERMVNIHAYSDEYAISRKGAVRLLELAKRGLTIRETTSEATASAAGRVLNESGDFKARLEREASKLRGAAAFMEHIARHFMNDAETVAASALTQREENEHG